MSKDIRRDELVPRHAIHIRVLQILNIHLRAMQKWIKDFHLINISMQVIQENMVAREIEAELYQAKIYLQ